MNVKDYILLSAQDIANGVKEKRFTAREVIECALDLIKQRDKEINALITLCEEKALAKADEIDVLVASGNTANMKLLGVPYVASDNFCTAGVKTTCASHMLDNWTPFYDATVITLLDKEGAILLGKTNMDEFAMGSTTESSIFGATRNPREASRVSGGPFGGSAAAVSAGYVPFALASDTGGSVRQPAASCGVQGFKPSYGQVSRFGVIACASSFDQVGYMTRSSSDVAFLTDILAVADEKNDSTCDAYDRPVFTKEIANFDIKGKKIAVLTGFDKSLLDEKIIEAEKRAVEILRQNGAEVFEVDLPIAREHSAACYYMTVLGDASSKLACFDGMRYGYHEDGKNLMDMYKNTRDHGFGDEVKKRILIGTSILTRGFYENYFEPSIKVRSMIKDEFDELFKKADAVLAPISAGQAPFVGESATNKEKNYLSDALASMANLVGLPSFSVSLEQGSECVSLQVMAQRFEDSTAIAVAKCLENSFGTPKAAE